MSAKSFGKVPADWVKVNETKKARRYHPPHVLQLTTAAQRARDRLAVQAKQAWSHFLGYASASMPCCGCHGVNYFSDLMVQSVES